MFRFSASTRRADLWEAARRRGPDVERILQCRDGGNIVAEGKKADVILANNVLAHVDGINAFVEGFAVLLKDDGIAKFEFPYLRDLIDSCAFDTIYHEHVFYYSLAALEPLFNRHGLHLERRGAHRHSRRLAPADGQQAGGEIAASKNSRPRRRRSGWGGSIIRSSAPGWRSSATPALPSHGTHRRWVPGRGLRGCRQGRDAAELGIGGETLAYAVDRNVHKVGKYMPGLKLIVRPAEALSPTSRITCSFSHGTSVRKSSSSSTPTRIRAGRLHSPRPGAGHRR